MARVAFLPGEPAVKYGLLARWGLLTAGLVAEGIALTVSFESPAASASDHWWIWVAAVTPDLIRIGVAFFGALLLLLVPRLKYTAADAWEYAADHRWQPWMLLQLLAFTTLYGVVSVAGLGNDIAGGTGSGPALVLCEGLGIATILLWLLALAPARYWRVFVTSDRLALAIAVAAALAAWLGGEIAQAYWKPLASLTLFLAGQLLRPLYPDVVADQSQLLLGTPSFSVEIAPQCSGYEGVGLISVFLAIYLWLFRSRMRFPAALLLLPIGALVIWLANVLRIAALVAIGSSYSSELAVGGFHSQAGWISFVALALGIIAVTHRAAFFTSEGGREDVNSTAAALLVPFLALMAAMMVTAAFSTGFDRLYPLRVIAMAAALLWFRRVYVQWDWGWSWASIGIGGAVFIVWMAFERMTTGDGATLGAGIAALGPGETVAWIGFRVAGSVLFVPMVEEMAFRGYLLRRLAAVEFQGIEASRFTWVSLLLSSAAFGLMHGRWLAGTVAGMAYAWAYYRRGKLGDAVAAHVTTNGLIAALVLITGAWSLWS